MEAAALDRIDLREANLIGANLEGVDLSRTEIDDATQIDDKWRLVWEIVNQDIAGRDLQGIDLSGADLRFADLNGTNLSGANLSRATYDQDTIWPEGFDPASSGAILVE